MARLYANENFPFPVVIELRRRGHDVLTIQETGKADQAIPDEAVLAFACTEQRALLTFNRKHFIRLQNSQSDHSGIIVCSFDSNFVALAERIHESIGKYEALAHQLIRINRPPRARRRLP